MSATPSPRRNTDLASALEQARSRFTIANPESLARHRRARAVLPGGNTRSVLHYEPFPLTMVRGEGARLVDADGHEYRDFLGEYTAGLYGHSDPRIRAAVERALAEGIALCAPNPHEAELAALLCERFPAVEQVRFTNSGTEANLMAITAARAHTGRDAVMVFPGGYHGGVLNFGKGASPVNVPYPYVFGAYNDAERTLGQIEANAGRLAAILVEPMMGAGGAIPATVEFLAALRGAADQQGIVLIFDEVMTSRLSAGGLQALTGVMPDMTTFGKYLGGGLTIGAFGGRRDIMAIYDPTRPGALPHAGTFNNNVLSMAAGVVGLRDIYTAGVAEAHNARGDRLRERLNAIAAARGARVQVTGRGSLMSLHVQARPVNRPEDVVVPDPGGRMLVQLEMLDRGFYHAQRGFVTLSLPLDDEDLEAFAGAFDEVLALHGHLLPA